MESTDVDFRSLEDLLDFLDVSVGGGLDQLLVDITADVRLKQLLQQGTQALCIQHVTTTRSTRDPNFSGNVKTVGNIPEISEKKIGNIPKFSDL